MDQPVDRPFRILQLTDCHLYARPDGELLGVDTQRSLEAVVDAVRAEATPPDLVVLTGDLVHDGSAEGYRRLARTLSPLGAPMAALPGNHDDPRAMAEVLPPLGIQFCGRWEAGNWLLLFLNSHLPGSDAGRLPAETLAQLCREGETGRDLVVFVHHHPLPVGNRWLDTLALENGQALLQTLEALPRARALVWGHVHQTWEGRRGRLQLLGTPSTCIQFAPRQAAFGVGDQPPGWRWIHLHGDGRLESRVQTLENAHQVIQPAGGW